MLEQSSKILINILEKNNSKSLNHRDQTSLFNLASLNRVTYHFLKNTQLKSKTNLKLKQIYTLGKNLQKNIIKTEKLIDIHATDLRYVYIKSSPDTRNITSDIDILFENSHDYRRFIKRLKQIGFSYSADEKYKCSLTKKGYTRIEPHIQITWYGRKYVDKNIVFERDSKLISNEVTFITSLAHILFDQNYISAKDYLLLKRHYNNTETVIKAKIQAEKYGWSKALNYILNLLEKIDKSQHKKFRLPVWVPPLQVIKHSTLKYIFDINTNNKSFTNIQCLTKPLTFYYWKILCSKLSKNPYRNSWLY